MPPVLYKVTSDYFLSKPIKAGGAQSSTVWNGSSQILVGKRVSVPTGDLGARIFSVEPLLRGLLRRRKLEKGKGCDIGYALAISSCEEANSVDACTVTALDAIAAFAVPNPNCPRRAVGFFRSGCSSGYPAKLITQPTSDWQNFI
jgi:hypothetical protein